MSGNESIFPLDPEHPNYERWKRAIDASIIRGELVRDLIGEFLPIEKSTVLDAGCGVGGTSIAFHEAGAQVVAMDRNPLRLEALAKQRNGIQSVQAELADLPFNDDTFDAAILQDVIEHVSDPETALKELYRVLHPHGMLYLSTPNKLSIGNIIADPHWGLPLASLKNREQLREYLAIRRPNDANRNDLAQLFSLKELNALLASVSFEPVLLQREVAQIMFSDPSKVVWSDMHLAIIKWSQKLGIDSLAKKLINDSPGFVNTYISPSWYLVARKAHV